MTISEFFKKHQKDYSMYRIAKETGISQVHVAKIFEGTSAPSAQKFFSICKAIKIDLKEITKFAIEVTKEQSK